MALATAGDVMARGGVSVAQEFDAGVSRFGRDGNTAVLDWCPVCVEYVATTKATCPWCDSDVLPERPAEPAAVVVEPVAVQAELGGDVDAVQEVPKIPPRRTRRSQGGNTFTDEQLIARAHLWARVTGEPPTKRGWNTTHMKIAAGATRHRLEVQLEHLALYTRGDWPSEQTVRERFGSWNAFMVACGFPPRAPGRPAKRKDPLPKPRTGMKAIAEYYAALVDRAEHGDRVGMKEAMYDLAMSAIVTGDNLPTGAR